MKKLIFLFLLWGIFCNAQYNLFARQNFNYKTVSTGTNTEIGGVASTISTPALLATKLGILESRITNFSIVGSDIKCKITGSYAIPSGAFQNNTAITYFDDLDNLVIDLGISAFKNDALGTSKLRRLSFNGIINLTGTLVTTDSQIEKLYLGSCISIPNNAFPGTGGFRSIPYYYIPLCTSLGTTSGDNGVFTNSLLSGSIVICHPSLATNNGGSPDGDIQSAISQGATIRYKTNTTAPSQITTLAAGTIYNTAIQLNFTPPSSTNAIEYYECYANGVLKNTITASGEYITGLIASTSYNITVFAVDIFYNKSAVSNTLTQSTNTTAYFGDKTIATYHLQTNGVDSKNAYNGIVGSGVYFSSGAVFANVTNSNILIPDNNALSFTNGTNDLPFSVSFKINFSALGSQMIVNKRGNTGASDEWAVEYSGGVFYFELFSNSGSAFIYHTYTFTPTTGVDYIFTLTYSGGGVSGMKIYRDGTLRTTTPNTIGTYTKMPNGTAPVTIGAQGWSLSGNRLTAKLKELYFFNSELTSTEVIFLQTNNYPF